MWTKIKGTLPPPSGTSERPAEFGKMEVNRESDGKCSGNLPDKGVRWKMPEKVCVT